MKDVARCGRGDIPHIVIVVVCEVVDGEAVCKEGFRVFGFGSEGF